MASTCLDTDVNLKAFTGHWRFLAWRVTEDDLFLSESKHSTTKLKAVHKSEGTKTVKRCDARERRARARGLTDCSIRKPISAG